MTATLDAPPSTSSDLAERGGEEWSEDGHKVTLRYGRDYIHTELICPLSEGRCTQAEPGEKECWLRTWWDNVQPEELYCGKDFDLTYRKLPLAIMQCIPMTDPSGSSPSSVRKNCKSSSSLGPRFSSSKKHTMCQAGQQPKRMW